jgi:hypothetical protein
MSAKALIPQIMYVLELAKPKFYIKSRTIHFTFIRTNCLVIPLISDYVAIQHLEYDTFPKYEEAYRQRQIEKMTFDEDTVMYYLPRTPVWTE